MQRPVAGPQRSDVRHRIRGILLDAARIAWRMGHIRRFCSLRPSSIPSSGAPSSGGSRWPGCASRRYVGTVVGSTTPRWRWFVAHSRVGERSAVLRRGERSARVSGPCARRQRREAVHRSARGGLCTRQARPVLRGSRAQRLQGHRCASIPNSPGNVRIWAAIASRRPCSCCPKDCATGGSTRPIRRTSCVCISKGDWTTGSSADAPRYRMPSRPPSTSRVRHTATTASPACIHSRSSRSNTVARVVLGGESGPDRGHPQRGDVRAAAVAVSRAGRTAGSGSSRWRR